MTKSEFHLFATDKNKQINSIKSENSLYLRLLSIYSSSSPSLSLYTHFPTNVATSSHEEKAIRRSLSLIVTNISPTHLRFLCICAYVCVMYWQWLLPRILHFPTFKTIYPSQRQREQWRQSQNVTHMFWLFSLFVNRKLAAMQKQKHTTHSHTQTHTYSTTESLMAEHTHCTCWWWW